MKKVVKAIEIISIALLIVLSSVVLLQVILRNVMNIGFVWGEEMSRFLLLSMVLLSAPIVFYLESHVKFDLIVRILSPGAIRIYRIISVLLIMFFYAVYIYSHLTLMKNSGNVVSPSLRIPNSIFFSSALIGAISAEILGAAKILEIIKTREK